MVIAACRPIPAQRIEWRAVSKIYDIDSLLDEVVTLPSLPGAVAEVMRLVNDPECDIPKLAKAIASDPPLSLKTLRIVNSVMYGLQHKVASIDHAVVLLGMKVIKNLAFSATVCEMIDSSMKTVFEHSLTCAVAMRSLVEGGVQDALLESAEEAFTCGLLHDIGKVLLEEFLPEECHQIEILVQEQHLPLHLAEVAVVGVDHARLGAQLAIKWKLPPHIISAIGAHHDLAQCQEAQHAHLASMIQIANYIAHRSGFAHSAAPIELAASVWATAEISGEKMMGVMERFFVNLPTVSQLMQLTD